MERSRFRPDFAFACRLTYNIPILNGFIQAHPLQYNEIMQIFQYSRLTVWMFNKHGGKCRLSFGFTEPST